MRIYTGLDYVKITMANAYGNGINKLPTFEEQLTWVDNTSTANLYNQVETAEEPMLYKRALNAYIDCLNDEPTGFTANLDASVSGVQMLSVLTGDLEAAKRTGLARNYRGTFYTDVSELIDSELENTDLDVSYKECKAAVMTAFYMSEAEPEKVFGKDNLSVFNATLEHCAPRCFELLQYCLRLHTKLQKPEYSWEMPNGTVVKTPNLMTNVSNVEMLGGNFKFNWKEKKYNPAFKGLLANIAHSTDAFVATEIGDRVDYNPEVINHCLSVLGLILLSYDGDIETKTVPSIRWINDIGAGRMSIEETMSAFTLAELAALEQLAQSIVKFKPMPNYEIHDEFWSYPDGLNAVRYHYQMVMGQIAQSNLLDKILTSICGKPVTITKQDISEEVFNGEYGIC